MYWHQTSIIRKSIANENQLSELDCAIMTAQNQLDSKCSENPLFPRPLQSQTLTNTPNVQSFSRPSDVWLELYPKLKVVKRLQSHELGGNDTIRRKHSQWIYERLSTNFPIGYSRLVFSNVRLVGNIGDFLKTRDNANECLEWNIQIKASILYYQMKTNGVSDEIYKPKLRYFITRFQFDFSTFFEYFVVFFISFFRVPAFANFHSSH